MLMELTESVRETILLAARKLTGFRRRQFQAEMAIKYCRSSPRRAERVFGWGREAVHTGLNELRTGIRCVEDYSTRGRPKSEEQRPELVQAIHALVEPKSQVEPKFQTPLAYTRVTAKAVHPGVRRLLIDLDNGPEIASSPTQFMKRLVESSDRHPLTMELAYYPPYHSKYNPIERCWGILENHWNGALLTSVQTALEWAKTMTWRGPARASAGPRLRDRRSLVAASVPPHRRPPRTLHLAPEMESRDPSQTRVDYFPPAA